MKLLALTLIFFIHFKTAAQSVVDNLSSPTSDQMNAPIFEEKLTTISASRRTLIITDTSNGFAPGDYLSLIKDNQLVARVLVAKIKKKLAGVKVVKIYSIKEWGKLRNGSEIKVLRGDDSYFQNSQNTDSKKEEEIIKDEDDLYSEEVLSELEENKNRVLKTDNLLGIFLGQYRSLDTSGSKRNYPHYGGHWAFQFSDNWWSEFIFGISRLTNFPATDIDTELQSFSGRVKYTFSAPFYSYIMPYVGFQIVRVDAPGAGDVEDEEKSAQELALVKEAEENKIIFGVSILKRLVPGWFAMANIGTDVIDLGIGLEF